MFRLARMKINIRTRGRGFNQCYFEFHMQYSRRNGLPSYFENFNVLSTLTT